LTQQEEECIQLYVEDKNIFIEQHLFHETFQVSNWREVDPPTTSKIIVLSL
jgi:hypothetical protein